MHVGRVVIDCFRARRMYVNRMCSHLNPIPFQREDVSEKGDEWRMKLRGLKMPNMPTMI